MQPDLPTVPAGAVRRDVARIERGVETRTEDWLAEEVPVQVGVNGASFAVMMLSPHDLEDFAWGFALSERLVHSAADIDGVDIREVLEGIVLDIRCVAAPREVSERELPGRSGCGICGSRALEDVVQQPALLGTGVTIDDGVLERALASLREAQPVNAMTGSVHAAGWCSMDGQLLLVREDVGRHNALDKLVGATRRSGIDPLAGFVVITSRASYEMVTKTATAGITLLAAISAPTALAVQLARSCGLTLIGFARPGRHVVYAHAQRLRRQA